MVEMTNNPGGQLPPVSPTTGVQPTGGSGPAANSPAAQGPVPAALAILMNTSLSPYEMADQFDRLKEQYLKQSYGVDIE